MNPVSLFGIQDFFCLKSNSEWYCCGCELWKVNVDKKQGTIWKIEKRVCHKSVTHPFFVYVSIYSSWIVVFLHKGNLIILYRNFTFLVLSITKQPQSPQKGIVIPDDKTTKIEFYRFIPKYFFKLNPIPNNPRSM